MIETIKPTPEGLLEDSRLSKKELKFFPEINYPKDFIKAFEELYPKKSGYGTKTLAPQVHEMIERKAPNTVGFFIKAQLMYEEDPEKKEKLSNLLEQWKQLAKEAGLKPDDYLPSDIPESK